MAVLFRHKWLGAEDYDADLLPGVSGYNDVGSAFSGSETPFAAGFIPWDIDDKTFNTNGRSLRAAACPPTDLGLAQSWIVRPGNHPTTGSPAVTGAWSARLYYRRTTNAGATTSDQEIITFRSGTTNKFKLSSYCYNESLTDKHRFNGVTYSPSTAYANSGALSSRTGWQRIEIQFDPARTPSLVFRCYYEDNTTVNKSFTMDPTECEWDNFRIGPAGKPSQRIQYWGHFEVHDDYTLGGQFTSNPTSPTAASTTAVGAPSTNQTFDARFNIGAGSTSTTGAPLTGGTDYTEYLDVNYTTAGTYKRKLDLYVPTGTPPAGGWPTVIWCHSGYFTEGSRKDLPVAWRNDLLDAGYAVATVEYVLSGKAGESYGTTTGGVPVGGRYPSHIIDLKRAGAFLRDNANTYGIDSTKFVTSGYSAGGYIALSALVTKDVATDSQGNPLTIAGATAAGHAWGDGYTGTDPSFLGAVMYNAPVDMNAAVDWDPGYPNSLPTICVAMDAYMDSTANVVPPYSKPADAPHTAVQNLLQLNGAHAVPTLYIRGTADYLVHWEHADLLLDGLTAIGEEDFLTIVDEPTIHKQQTYDKTVVIDYLDALTAGNSAYFEVPTPMGVSVQLPSATAEGNGSGTPGIFDAPELQVDVKSAGPTGSADLPISTFGQDPPTIFDAPVIGVGVSTLGVEVTGGGTPGGIFEAEAPITVAARISPISVYVSPPIILPPTSPLGSDVAAAPEWTIKLYPPGSNTPSGMIAASAKTIELNLTEPSTGEFSVSGFDTTTNLIEEFVTDAVWTRDDRDMLRCRIGGSSDVIDADKHMVTFNGADYRALLDRRFLTNTISTTAAPDEQFDIVWDMITQTQNADGGNLGLVQHPQWQASGVSRGDVWEVGRSIGEAITEMGNRRTIDGLYGYDWDINPDLTVQMFTPNRGFETGFTIEYGTNCDQVKRTVSSTDYANFVATQWTNKDGVEFIATANSTDLVTRPEGRWEYWEGGSWATTGEGNAFAGGKLALMQGILPSYECRLLVNTWDPTRCWLGDVVGLVIQSGRLNVRPPVGLYRVQKIRVVIGDSGNEEVTITLGNPSYKVASRLWLLGRSVSELERR